MTWCWKRLSCSRTAACCVLASVVCSDRLRIGAESDAVHWESSRVVCQDVRHHASSPWAHHRTERRSEMCWYRTLTLSVVSRLVTWISSPGDIFERVICSKKSIQYRQRDWWCDGVVVRQQTSDQKVAGLTHSDSAFIEWHWTCCYTHLCFCHWAVSFGTGQLATCVNYADLNNCMLRMHIHIPPAFFEKSPWTHYHACSA